MNIDLSEEREKERNPSTVERVNVSSSYTNAKVKTETLQNPES